MNTAPSQHPQPSTTMTGSRMRRVNRNGRTGVNWSHASARCAPATSAARDSDTVMSRIAMSAMKLYPPFLETGPENGSRDGSGRSFASARKTSLMNEEKEVKQPQKPVVRPMYNGMVFLAALCAFNRSCSFIVSWFSPHSSRKRFLSSRKKPMSSEPLAFAHNTPVTIGAPV